MMAYPDKCLMRLWRAAVLVQMFEQGEPAAYVSLYKQLEPPFADVAGLAIGDPAGQRFSSTEQQQYTTITTIGHEC